MEDKTEKADVNEQPKQKDDIDEEFEEIQKTNRALNMNSEPSKEEKEQEEEQEQEEEEKQEEKPPKEPQEEKEQEEEQEEKQEEREPRYEYVSLQKHKKVRAKLKDAQKELEQLKEGKDETVTASDIQEVLDKYNLDDTNKSFIQDLVGALEKKVGVPKDLLDHVQKSQQEAEKIKRQAQEDKDFAQDYNSTFFELDNNGKVKKDRDGQPIVKEGFEKANRLKDKVHELAFTKQFANAPLDAVYLYAERTMPKGKKTAETSFPQGERQSETTKTFAEVTPEDVEKMDLETYEKYSDWEQKKELSEGYEISRGGQRIKV